MKKSVKTVISIFLAALFIIGAVSFLPINAAETKAATHTVMMYVVGSNLESLEASATDNLKQVLASTYNENLNFIVMTGGANEWHMEGEFLSGADKIDPEYNQVWKVEGKRPKEIHGTMTLLEEEGLEGVRGMLMSDGDVLREFIDYCYENYPADSYDIIFWNHGGGPAFGFGQIEGTKLALHLSEMMDAFSKSALIKDGKKFGIIGFDACMMSNVEIILTLGRYTDYIVASSETMPSDGLEYSSWLNKLKSFPSISDFDLANEMISGTFNFYRGRTSKGITLAVIDPKNFEDRLIDDLILMDEILISEAKNRGEINGRYNFYDELYSLENSITYSRGEYSLYDLSTLLGALSAPQSECDNIEAYQIAALENAYTECALRICSVLNDYDGSADDAIHSFYTAPIRKKSSLGCTRDIEGNILTPDDSGTFTIDPSCVSIFFGGTLVHDDGRYLEEMMLVAERLPEGKVKEFILKNATAVAYYSMITLLGKTVSELAHGGDVTLEAAISALNESSDKWAPYYENAMKTLVGTEFASESDAKAFLSEIVAQQAAEAVTSNKITAKQIVYPDGTSDAYQATVKGSSAQAFMSLYSTTKIEIDTHSDGFEYIARANYGDDADVDELFPSGVSIDLGKLEGSLKIADFLEDINDTDADLFSRIYASDTSSWIIEKPEEYALVMYDAAGAPRICDVHYLDGACETAYIPLIIAEDGESGTWSIYLCISKDDNGWHVDGYSFDTGDAAERLYYTISSAWFDGKKYVPGIDVTDDVYGYSLLMPLGDVSDTDVDKDDWGITFGYMPIAEIEGVLSRDTCYYVEDVYGNTVDVTDVFAYADKAAEKGDVVGSIDFAEITVDDATYDGREQRPKVAATLDGKTLTEGVDYKVIYDGIYADKGKAYVAVLGIGDYVGTAYCEYTIMCPEHSYVIFLDVPATCTEDGYREYVCTDCGASYKDVYEATGHVLTYHKEKKATKNADGNIAYYTCDKCGKYFADGNGEKEISAEYVVRKYFKYEHDPKNNPKAMEDIVEDENAIYGFIPSDSGSLKTYLSYDWMDPEVIEAARQERIAYHKSLESLYELMESMRAEGKSTEEIARAVSAKRNEIRLAAYDGDPEGLAKLKARNLEKFGHEEGPLADEVYAQTGSWEKVIEKAFTANSGMDACLGLYDDYYDFYVSIGQVKEESPVVIILIVAISVVVIASAAIITVIVIKKKHSTAK